MRTDDESAGWRDALAPLTERADGSGSPGAAPTVQLALLLDVRERVRSTGRSRWEHARDTTRSATAQSTGKLVVTAQPGVPGKRGAWTKAPFGWGSLQYRTHELGLDPAQVRWFVEFEMLSRAEPGRFSSDDGSFLVLDDYASPLLWRMLQDAPARGIRIVAASRGGSVAIGGRAALELEAADTAAGGLRLVPRASVDGVSAPIETARLDAVRAEAATADRPAVTLRPIGDHGLAVIDFHSGSLDLTLAPTERPVTPRELAVLRGGPIEVPAADVAEFSREVYPVLARAVTVERAAAARLPHLSPPVLVLTVAFEPRRRVRISADWEYRAGARVDRVPFASSRADPIRRDLDAESGILDRLRRLAPAAAVDDAAAFAQGAEATSETDVVTAYPMVAVVAERLLEDADAAEWVANALPAWEELAADPGAGIRIDIVGTRIEYRELTGEPELTITTVPTDQRDWFDLGVLVQVEGRTIPFMPLFTALATGRRRLLLVDHTYLTLNKPVFDRLKELLREADGLAEWEVGPRVSRYQAALWSEFEDLADVSQPAVEWRATVGGLLALTADHGASADREDGDEHADADGSARLVPREPLPAGLTAELRPYQRDGYDWLVFLWRHGLGGVLADDMGLGKTVQTLALIAHAREPGPGGPGAPGGQQFFRTSERMSTQCGRDGACPENVSVGEGAVVREPFLVVAPTSVVSNWAVEAERFTPGLRVASVTATRRKDRTPLAEAIEGADIVLTTYTVLRLDRDEFAARRWAGLVLDEAQFVKNHVSQAHAIARDLDAPFRLAVTGTPMENNLLELWAMFSIVAPGLFPSRRRFIEEYVKPIAAAASPAHGTDEAHGAARLARLRRRIRPLMLRRTKDVVAPELPPKQEQVVSIPLDPKHRRLYDTWLQRERQKVLGLLDDLDRQRFIVYRSITLLRMLAVDASLIDPEYADVPSSKLDALLDRLGNVVSEGHRTLVFSQFTSYLHKVAARLDAAGVRYEYLDGSTTSRRRAEVIRSFREGDAPVFLISLKAGGFGLTLTEADYVFLLDPWWNPAAEAQAVDRTHRIGQTKQVMVYRMVASDTIEQKVMRLGERKAALFDAVLDDDGAFSAALSADDIRQLLQ